MACPGRDASQSSWSVRPKIRGRCAICGEAIPISYKGYYSLKPLPNNDADAKRKRDLVTDIQNILGDILDIEDSHILCSSCYRNAETATKKM